MTDAELKDCRLFFRPEQGQLNCRCYPIAGERKGLALLAEVDRLRKVLEYIATNSYRQEETSATWRDIAIDAEDRAKAAITPPATAAV